jgi:hypothetical protein
MPTILALPAADTLSAACVRESVAVMFKITAAARVCAAWVKTTDPAMIFGPVAARL